MKLSSSILPIFFTVSFGVVFARLETSVAKPESTASGSLPAIIFVEAPKVVPGELTERFPQGSRLVRLAPGTASHSSIDLTPGFFAVADPQVSFDTTRVLFAGQKSRGAWWQIWEMNADGSEPIQITHCSADCLRSAYLPRNQIVFTEVTRKGSARTSEIYVSQRSGAEAHPITFGPGDFQVETVLQSGRILVSGEAALDADGIDSESRVFYTLCPDGSGLSLFRWANQPNVIRTGAEELDDGTVLFVKRQGRSGRETGGELASIRPGALQISAITPLDFVFWSAHELDGNTLVVSTKRSDSSAVSPKFDLYTFNVENRTLGRLIYRDPALSSIQPVPLEPHSPPLYYWSILHPDRDYGRIICLNAYLSADAPQGHITTPIARVRVISLQADHGRQRVLGEAPVESDGSFYIKVPADHPIRFELLSAKGSVLRAQKSWIWARRGEDVGCVGCHESKVLVPADSWPLAVKRHDTPIPVGVISVSGPPQH